MENAKKVNPTKGTEEKQLSDGTGHIPSCPIWIFGNEDSAKKDLEEKFEIVEDAKKD